MIILDVLLFPAAVILPLPEILAVKFSHSNVASILPDPDNFSSNPDALILSSLLKDPEPDIVIPVKEGE